MKVIFCTEQFTYHFLESINICFLLEKAATAINYIFFITKATTFFNFSLIMSSTEFNIGLTTSAKPSSRVLQPPGGGHSDIFAVSSQAVNKPRPKYDQQNSSNLNFCMNTTDPNVKVSGESAAAEPETQAQAHAPVSNGNGIGGQDAAPEQQATAPVLPRYHHHNSTSLW